jgi:hypothetical protein
MVGSQIGNFTPGPSFAHNLGDRCPNDQCEAIFDIYASRPFQWHQEHPNARYFEPCCRTLNIRESRRTPNPHFFQVLGFTPTLGQSRVATHLDTSNISYGQKKGWELNWQFDFQSLKVRNRLDYLACRWCVLYRWEAFDEVYNFASELISIGGLHTKLWAPKVAKAPTLGISRFSLGNPGTKWHSGASPVTRHRVYYKGEGGGFPQVWAVVSLVSLCCPWLVHAPKCSNYALTNLWLGLCKSAWVINVFHFS